MDNYIVITSINKPTKAIIEFSRFTSYHTIVVGDKKTPDKWKYGNIKFISTNEQEKLNYQCLKYLPWNHYSRKMIGYLYSAEQGASIIIDTDDDNIPYSDWSFPDFSGEFYTTGSNNTFFNIYNFYSNKRIWPRGFPLKYAKNKEEVSKNLNKRNLNVGVWQGLVDGDPDVDAIYRLLDNTPCIFRKKAPLVLDSGTVCPYNSQNTAIRKELFPLLYLPAYVNFRFTDILRGLVAQPIMWAAGYNLGFTKATVFQERNDHDYMDDFVSEIPCYLYAEKIIELTSKVVNSNKSVTTNLFNAYEELVKNKIVQKKEIEVLTSWIKDISSFM